MTKCRAGFATVGEAILRSDIYFTDGELMTYVMIEVGRIALKG